MSQAPATAAPEPAPGEAPVVVIGAANVDLQAMAAAPLRLADSNPGRILSSAGGVGRNIAERLARQGRAVQLLSLLGDDADGEWLRQQGRQAGIGMDGCITVAGAATARYLSLHQPDGEMLAAVNDMELLSRLDATVLQAWAPRLAGAAALVIEANLPPATLAALWPLLPPDLAVWADAVSAAKAPRLAPHLARLHTLKPNRLEALQLSGLAEATPHQALADALLDRGLAQLALSLGADGLWLAQRLADGTRRHHHQPALPVAVRSVTGAGDALLAGLLHAQLAGCGPAESAAHAMACAAAALSGRPPPPLTRTLP